MIVGVVAIGGDESDGTLSCARKRYRPAGSSARQYQFVQCATDAVVGRQAGFSGIAIDRLWSAKSHVPGIRDLEFASDKQMTFTHVHNGLLNAAVDGGILGVLAVLGLLGCSGNRRA